MEDNESMIDRGKGREGKGKRRGKRRGGGGN